MTTSPDSDNAGSRWDRIRDLFDEASALEPEARERYLEHLTGDAEVRTAVRRLLAAHDRFDHSEARPGETRIGEQLDAFAALGAHDGDPAVAGFRLGPILGEGGMGRVYRATRLIGDTEQTVALKIVPFALRSARAVEQLRLERRILAALDHPNIARLIDAGELPDGRPYFAMEYVDGVPVTRYCDEHALDGRARLTLFLEVCEAVAHAHRQLVLHRDIKPGNVLVDTQGRVRLVDFGIGKSIAGQAPGHETTLGSGFFSLYSAAPEQLLGRPTTVATDVYGLGCLLYELAAGRTAFVFDVRSREDILRTILDEPPPRASDVAATPAQKAALRGDLDAVIARALRKDPADRHRSADELAADVRSVLEYRPIAARSPERWYRVKMFIKRHRATVAMAAALGVAVIAATTMSVVQSGRAAAERDRAVAALASAQLQRDHARRVTDFLVNSFKAADPTQERGGVLRIDDLLAAATASMEHGAATDDPLLRATIAQTLTNLFYLLNRVADTKRQSEIGRKALASMVVVPDELRASQLLADAQAAYLESRIKEAVEAASQGVAVVQGNPSIENGALLSRLLRMRLRAMEGVEAPREQLLALYDQALETVNGNASATPDEIDWLRYRKAVILSSVEAGREEALNQLLDLLSIQEARPSVEDATVIETMRLVGQTYMRMGRYREALHYVERAFRLHVERYGEGNARFRPMLLSLAGVYSNVGRHAESMQLYRRFVDLVTREESSSSQFLTPAYFNMGWNYFSNLGDAKQGEFFIHRALETCAKDSRHYRAWITRYLGEILLARRSYEAGYYVQAANDGLKAIRPGSDDRRLSDINLAYYLFRQYRFADARQYLTPEAIAEVRNSKPAVADNFREIKRELDEMAAFYRL